MGCSYGEGNRPWKKPKLAFNFDGGDVDKLTVGATGGERLDITIEGIPSHAGVAPEQGVSAITIASLAIASLHEDGWHGLVEKIEEGDKQYWGHSGRRLLQMSSQKVLLCGLRQEDTTPSFEIELLEQLKKPLKKQ